MKATSIVPPIEPAAMRRCFEVGEIPLLFWIYAPSLGGPNGGEMVDCVASGADVDVATKAFLSPILRAVYGGSIRACSGIAATE